MPCRMREGALAGTVVLSGSLQRMGNEKAEAVTRSRGLHSSKTILAAPPASGVHSFHCWIDLAGIRISVCIPRASAAQSRISGEASPDFSIDTASAAISAGGFWLATIYVK